MELDALCITELIRSSSKEREQTGQGTGAESNTGTDIDELRKPAPLYDKSSWAGKKIESILASRIIEQDRLERLIYGSMDLMTITSTLYCSHQ